MLASIKKRSIFWIKSCENENTVRVLLESLRVLEMSLLAIPIVMY